MPTRAQALRSPKLPTTTTTTTSRASIRDTDWRWIRRLFPRNLDALAKETEAVTFFRELRSGEILLRLLLLWSLGSMGLRSVSAWAARARWGSLTEGALRYRFRQCESFVAALIAHVLSSWLRIDRSAGLPLRIIDATMVAVPGPSGRCFRLHTTYDPSLGVMTGVELTDDSQGESTSRAPVGVRDVLIANRGYGRAKELVALSFRVVFWIVRVYLPSVPLWNKQGERLDSRPLVRACASAGRAIERAVELRFGQKKVAARLIIAPLPSEAATPTKPCFECTMPCALPRGTGDATTEFSAPMPLDRTQAIDVHVPFEVSIDRFEHTNA